MEPRPQSREGRVEPRVSALAAIRGVAHGAFLLDVGRLFLVPDARRIHAAELEETQLVVLARQHLSLERLCLGC